MFKFFKKKIVKPWLKINQLSKSIVIQSKQINIDEWDYGKNKAYEDEMIPVNDQIKINFYSAWTTDKIHGLFVGWLHYFCLNFSIEIKNIKVRTYQVEKDLKNYEMKDYEFEVTEAEYIHNLTDEWIISINDWSSSICKEFDEEAKRIQIEEKNNKERKLKLEKKKLYEE